MSTNPDQIRQEIESTRAELSGDVNALADSVKPGNVARRQVDKARDGVMGVKDSVMGTAEDATQSVSGAAGDAKSAVRSRTRGNPLAAGLVAFAAGWLVSSLLPATQVERQGATALKEKAQPLTEELGSAAKQVAEEPQGAGPRGRRPGQGQRSRLGGDGQGRGCLHGRRRQGQLTAGGPGGSPAVVTVS